MPRLVAVLGYSGRRDGGIHPICAARLAVAEQTAEAADTVVFSGWARRPSRDSEAALMRAAWTRPDVALVADGDARTTAGNARAVAAAVREAGATDVVVVTSWWHRPRARALLRAALGKDVHLEVVAARRPSPPHVLLRELACLLALPLQLVSLRSRVPR